MHSKDNTRRQSPKQEKNKLDDPFAELFARPFTKEKNTKQDTTMKSKNMDDILFSKINPLDISLNSSKQTKGSIIFEEDGQLAKRNLNNNIREPLVKNTPNTFILPKEAEKENKFAPAFNSIKMKAPAKSKCQAIEDSNKIKEELLCLLSTQQASQQHIRQNNESTKNTPGMHAPAAYNNGSLMDTPQSPHFDQNSSKMPAKDQIKINHQRPICVQPIITTQRMENIKNTNRSNIYGCLPDQQHTFRHFEPKHNINQMEAMPNNIGPIPHKMQYPRANQAINGCFYPENTRFVPSYHQNPHIQPFNGYNPYSDFDRQNFNMHQNQLNMYYRPSQRHDPYHQFNNPQLSNSHYIRPPFRENSNMYVNNPRNDILPPYNLNSTYQQPSFYSKPIEKQNRFLFKLKLFRLSQMTIEQKQQIDKISLAPDNLKYRFFRTMGEVSNILKLPKLTYSEVHELRLLFNLFGRYGGYFNTNANFLNHVKDKLTNQLFKYLSYALPLETSGYYYKPQMKNKKVKNRSNPTKEELNTVLCIGIYDDIFYFLELLDKYEISEILIGELINLFFLVSDNLFKKFESPLLILNKIVNRLNTKPYIIVFDKMPRTILYQLQEQIFKIILKYECNRKTEQSFNEDTLFCIIETILQRKILKRIPEIADIEIDGSELHTHNNLKCKLENEKFWVINLISAVSTMVRPTPRIIEILFELDSTHSWLVLRVASKIQLYRPMLHKLFINHEGYILTMLKTHTRTIKNRILLNDEKELETIVCCFLPFIFNDRESIMHFINIISEYKDFLLEKQIYFRKRKSSNIDNILKHLNDTLSEL